tara:strand:- start:29 stop:820 length:792 start_codon:yes stop_codon:yes gene_type:complete
MNCINCSSNIIDYDEFLDEFVCGECRLVLVNRIHEDVIPITYKPNVTEVRKTMDRLQTEVNMITSEYVLSSEVQEDLYWIMKEHTERDSSYLSENYVDVLAKAIVHHVFKLHMIPNDIKKSMYNYEKKHFKRYLKDVKRYIDTPWWRHNSPERSLDPILSNLYMFKESYKERAKQLIFYMDRVLQDEGIGQLMSNYAMMVYVHIQLDREMQNWIVIDEIARVFFTTPKAIKNRWKNYMNLFHVSKEGFQNLTFEEFILGVRYE